MGDEQRGQDEEEIRAPSRAAEENRRIHIVVLRDGCTKPQRKAPAFRQRNDSRAEVLRNTISAFCSFPKNVSVVLLHVTNVRVFRWVLWRKVKGKNTPVLTSRAIRDTRYF